MNSTRSSALREDRWPSIEGETLSRDSFGPPPMLAVYAVAHSLLLGSCHNNSLKPIFKNIFL